MTTILDGKKVAAAVGEKVKTALELSEKHGIKPKIAFVRIGDLSDSIAYENSAKRLFGKFGIEAEQHHFPADVSLRQFLNRFREINQDYSVNGILLLQPVPDHIDMKRVIEIMNPVKDIDGITPMNMGKVITGDKDRLEPCTPAGVIEMLDYYDIPLEGKKVTIVGASNVVGKPLSILMMNRGATVTVCNVHTPDLVAETKDSDVIVSAAGVVNLIREEHVKEGAVIVDVGINVNDNGKIVGDVDFEGVKDKCSFISPVPGGAGSVTSSLLVYQLMLATDFQKEPVLFLEN